MNTEPNKDLNVDNTVTFTPKNEDFALALRTQTTGYIYTLQVLISASFTQANDTTIIKGDDAHVAHRILEEMEAQHTKSGELTAPQIMTIINNYRSKPAAIDLDAAQAKADMTLQTKRKTVVPKGQNQCDLVRSIQANDLSFGLGPAGCGKTYLAVAAAVHFLERGDYDRIILTRPAVEAGEKLGYLPGDMKEKVDPFMQPLYDALAEMLGGKVAAKMIEEKVIEIAPLAYMRGRTLKNAFVILDEAQNATDMQMKMFLTRLGEGSRMVVVGDPGQTDLGYGQVSGLQAAREKLEGIDGIGIVTLTAADVLRHPLVAKIVQAYEG